MERYRSLSTGAQATPKLPIDFDTFGRFNPFLNIRNEFKAGNLKGFGQHLEIL